MKPSFYGAIEAASRTLAPTKPEMETVLATWHRLGVQQGADAAYLNEIWEAQAALDQSADVPEFLSRLRGEPIASPPTSPSTMRRFAASAWGNFLLTVVIAAWLTHYVMAAIQAQWVWLIVATPIGPIVGFSWWWHWLFQYLKYLAG